MRLNSVLLWLTASIGRNQTISWGGFVPPDLPRLLQPLGEGGGCRHRPQPSSFNKNKRLGEDVRFVGCCPKLGNGLPKDGLRLETTPAAYTVAASLELWLF